LSPGPAKEVWPAAGPVAAIEIEGARAAADNRSIFVAIEADAPTSTAIDALAFEIYVRVLRVLTRTGYPHLLRVWNYVPHIHERSSGIERYMAFCKGRSEAFAAHYGDSFPDRLPAASAVGCPGDTLVVHLLASREPGRHLENPRQVSAFRYPERYGPKSPSFRTRDGGAVRMERRGLRLGDGEHRRPRERIPGDPVRQTEETMRNIEAVLDTAGVPGAEARWDAVFVPCAFTFATPTSRHRSAARFWPASEPRFRPRGSKPRSAAKSFSSRSKRPPGLRPTIVARKD
jgi:chorismate lyase/3-hydroxybenzoate synthase